MLNSVQDYVKTVLPAKRKTTPSGWTSFNAPCCQHNGESPDTRGRAGITSNTDGSVSYHCFNCNYKASYQPGRHLTFKFRKLLRWFGANESDIQRLVIEAVRIKDLVNPETTAVKDDSPISFAVRALPKDAVSFSEMKTFLALQDEKYVIPAAIANKITYITNRNIDLDKYNFYISEQIEHSLHQRVIIPCYWQGLCIGWTARAVTNGVKPKYFSQYEPNFVFNIDQQSKDAKFVVVVEGPFDAMSIDGVAVLGNECSEHQADIIDSLGREVIVVPDFDRKNGKWSGQKLVDAAQEYGWSVSFPVWRETCKDVNEAVTKYGKLFVLKSILQARESSRLKIELLKKTI